ncbi:hypothetical protein R5R35_014526 [Gryllus longicercus]|uniref:Uncharacterized protein n=1 Tax=Gryllus longicercus TaxID=2509291 RepID=A0AAN9VBL4_9ORTH
MEPTTYIKKGRKSYMCLAKLVLQRHVSVLMDLQFVHTYATFQCVPRLSSCANSSVIESVVLRRGGRAVVVGGGGGEMRQHVWRCGAARGGVRGAAAAAAAAVVSHMRPALSPVSGAPRGWRRFVASCCTRSLPLSFLRECDVMLRKARSWGFRSFSTPW